MLITEVKASKIRRTRHRNLRQGKPFSTTTYKKDNDKKTFHFENKLGIDKAGDDFEKRVF